MTLMKKVVLVLLLIIAAPISVILIHLYYRTDDLSLRYRLWKNGLYPYQKDVFLNPMYSDPNRNNLIKGKTKEQIMQIFPDSHEAPLKPSQYVYPNSNCDEAVWLGGSQLVICLSNGVGVYMRHEKKQAKF